MICGNSSGVFHISCLNPAKATCWRYIKRYWRKYRAWNLCNVIIVHRDHFSILNRVMRASVTTIQDDYIGKDGDENWAWMFHIYCQAFGSEDDLVFSTSHWREELTSNYRDIKKDKSLSKFPSYIICNLIRKSISIYFKRRVSSQDQIDVGREQQ